MHKLPVTYESIASTTLTGSQATVTFSSIPQTYTDLVLIATPYASVAAGLLMSFGDTSTLYSRTQITGNGSTATSAKATGEAFFYVGSCTTDVNNAITHIMNYSNTTTYKTVLTRDNYLSAVVVQRVGLWRNTAAISSIVLKADATNLTAGTVLSLYGIKSA